MNVGLQWKWGVAVAGGLLLAVVAFAAGRCSAPNAHSERGPAPGPHLALDASIQLLPDAALVIDPPAPPRVPREPPLEPPDPGRPDAP